MSARAGGSSRTTLCIAAISLAAYTLTACRPRAIPAAAPVAAEWPADEHCWWIAIRTTLPVDTVGRRFEHTFNAIGLIPAIYERIGDTVLVRGGPAEVAGLPQARYAGRAVAYQVGDSTRFRWYSSITPVGGRWATAADSASISARHIGFCAEIGKGVAIKGWAPRDPTADDSLSVWKRIP